MVGAAVRHRAPDGAGCDEVGAAVSYNAGVRGRYHIVLSTRSGPASDGQPQGCWARFTALLIGIGFLIVAVAVLVAALIFGSMLAAVLWVCLVVVMAVVILKVTWRRLRTLISGQ